MKTTPLFEVAKLFFRLGLTAFGGPAVHIALMEHEVVNKRKWFSGEHFLDLVGATNLVPGPNSTEITMHCGYERAGKLGLFVAGVCFIFPAFLLTLLLAFIYTEYGHLPEFQPFLEGLKPAVIPIILFAGYRLSKKALKNSFLYILGAFCLFVLFLGANNLMVLFGAGIIGVLYFLLKQPQDSTKVFSPIFIVSIFQNLNESHLKIFLTFLKIGTILYGSGYVLFAFLEEELVQTGILTSQELLDAIAIGQFTPGPVLTTATFIGYQLAGFSGAILATLGIFLPSFLFVLILNPLVKKIRKTPILSSFLDAINLAALALVFYVAIQMGRDVFIDWRTVLIGLISFILVFKFPKINSAYIILGGAILGFALSKF